MRKEKKNRVPILLLSYNRPSEFSMTINSLANAKDASEYDLIVHIDGPSIYNTSDFENQKLIKQTIARYSNSFCSIEIWEEKFHMGLAESVISSVTKVLDRFDRLIVIEDDLLLAYDSLVFLNDALEFYSSNKDVWSVTAYTPPINELENYEKDVYFGYRASSYAWGTWKDRWEEIDWEVEDFKTFLQDENLQVALCRGGYDLPKMLAYQMVGMIDSWAVRWCYAESKRNMLTVYPRENRVILIESKYGTHVKEPFEQAIMGNGSENYILTDYIDINLLDGYKKFNGSTYAGWKREIDDLEANTRFEAMFAAMDIWRIIDEMGYSISEYFLHRDYNIIALYGIGRIAKHIKTELLNAGIEKVFFIDKNEELCDGIQCFSIGSDIPKCDCVVITVMKDISEIKASIRRVMDADIKTFFDVLKDR